HQGEWVCHSGRRSVRAEKRMANCAATSTVARLEDAHTPVRFHGHYLGLLWMPRRTAFLPEGPEFVAQWQPWMYVMASSLTDQEITEVAGYYASLQPVSHAKAPSGVPVEPGKHLAGYGDMPARGLPACVQCHGPGGLGVGSTFPPLAGQPYKYIVEQFKAWQSGVRSGDPLGLMKHVAGLLTDEEVHSVAAYYAAQPVQGEKSDQAASSSASTGKTGTADNTTAKKTALPHHGEVEPGHEPGPDGYFQPPPRDAYPDGPFGENVRLGEAIFIASNTNSTSGKYVGNKQVCQGCHLDAGRLANAAPMWAYSTVSVSLACGLSSRRGDRSSGWLWIFLPMQTNCQAVCVNR
ncbi:MAG: c-type cytochrome, partial [Thiogranum sp.]